MVATICDFSFLVAGIQATCGNLSILIQFTVELAQFLFLLKQCCLNGSLTESELLRNFILPTPKSNFYFYFIINNGIQSK